MAWRSRSSCPRAVSDICSDSRSAMISSSSAVRLCRCAAFPSAFCCCNSCTCCCSSAYACSSSVATSFVSARDIGISVYTYFFAGGSTAEMLRALSARKVSTRRTSARNTHVQLLSAILSNPDSRLSILPMSLSSFDRASWTDASAAGSLASFAKCSRSSRTRRKSRNILRREQ